MLALPMRAIVLIFVISNLACCVLGCAGGDSAAPGGDAALDSTSDTKTKPDSTVDSGKIGDSPKPDGSDFDTSTKPPPIDDAGIEDFGTLPPPGSHVEAAIGPAGGTLKGTDGSALDKVQLVVPAGALTTLTTLAIDVAPSPGLPPTAKSASIYVKVGPDGTAFVIPARLTVPYSTTVTNPQLGVLARVGTNWSSLVDPSGDDLAKTLTASMTRASGATVVLLDLATTVPAPGAFAPGSASASDVVFLDGAGFGLAPVWRPGADGGLPFVSQVKIGSTVATALGWGDTSMSFRVPTGSTGGVISVVTPGGSGSTTKSLTVP